MSQSSSASKSSQSKDPGTESRTTNMDALAYLLSRIQTPPLQMSYKQIEYRVRLLELMLSDAELIEGLEDPDYKDQAIKSNHDAWETLTRNKKFVAEQCANLVMRIEFLEANMVIY
jgi:hypothetical protein